MLIGTNIPVKVFQGLKHYTTEQVIWRNAQTGKALASSSPFPKMTQGILVTPGYAGLQYFLTADGHIIALQVTPKTIKWAFNPRISGSCRRHVEADPGVAPECRPGSN